MIIGISCTFFQIKVDLAALDVLDKRKRIAESPRARLTVNDLISRIDQPHLRQIGILQFIEALTNYIPEASIYKAEINLRYRTRVCKLRAPVVKYNISPLATSGKSEASIPELKDAFVDFFEQIGQTEDDYDSRLLFVGGDGMSFNNMHLVKKFLQPHHPHPFQTFDIMRPVLAIWHTLWTDLCRIFETHWGPSLNDNVATLGHSAKKIGRSPPSNLKKVDYYPSAQLLTLVHDMRMLDCWRIHFETDDIFAHFSKLRELKKLPSFEELEIAAKKLFDTYVRMDATEEATGWTARAPLGSPWAAVPDPPPKEIKKRKSKKKAEAESEATKAPPKKPCKPKREPSPPPPFVGDQALFETGTFMHDAMIFREAAAATAQGDVGRVWEALKIMVFTFAGSTHSKYMGYLLEMICDLEFESNPYLKDATFLSMVVNPTGEEGLFKACDIFQEYLNACTEPIVQRKDAEYGSDLIRNIWARNIKDIHDLKKEYRKGLELTKRGGKHATPHERPEVKILLETYKREELHNRRPERTYKDQRDVNDFERGLKHLAGGALSKWATRTTRARLTHLNQSPPDENSDEEDSDSSDESDTETTMTGGDVIYKDGQLLVQIGELEEEDEDIFPAALGRGRSDSE
ncbi:hypothetical protein R3P38DRAFT_3332094 [Favolaschia claudopus]|uniref:DUF6589 domain-containing protein n=1 Tax=Favolaschia claudopus TaxID=2862362 RepID=A0AAV9ZQB2_9AGAR